MKALNKQTGQLEKVYVKALDSMPVGTIVEFNGQASDIPSGWEEVSGENKIRKVSLKTPTGAHIVDGYSTSTTDGYSCNEVNNLVQDVYSTDEVKTNKVWIDGKPIYRKVINVSGTPTSIPHEIDDLNKVINVSGYILRNESQIVNMSIPHSDTNTNYICDINYYSRTNIEMIYGTSIINNIAGLTLILEYTKTTD